jgi:hypothetical protein
MAITSFGTMLPTTETTPRPPIDISGSVRLSSPLRSGQIGRGHDLRGLIQRAGGLLDHRDVGQFGHADDRVRLDVLAGSAGNVVDANGNIDGLGQGLEMLKEALLRGLVVVGGDDQGGIGPALAAQRVSRRASSVLFEPVPAITLIRPPRLDHGRDHPLMLRRAKA